MVLLHIICKDRQLSDDIADLLVKENLVLEAVTFQNVSVRVREKNGTVGRSEQTMLIGRTRGLLFNTVQELLRERYPTNMPVIYSMPIVNMNWQDADALPVVNSELD
ncbi:MAG: hypothetical protein Roseis2KO_08570 [Roseivirga sp.]